MPPSDNRNLSHRAYAISPQAEGSDTVLRVVSLLCVSVAAVVGVSWFSHFLSWCIQT